VREWSPEGVAHLSQNRLMPLLIDSAKNYTTPEGAPLCSIEYGKKVISLENAAAGVDATVRAADGAETIVRSSYAIACALQLSSYRDLILE
jgi:hypothetical protein